MFRFIHAADIHLDSPLKGLEKYEGAPVDEIREATRRALENLVALAIDRAVHFVLIAGDVYDGNWRDHNTGLFFVNQMHRLREASIPVVMISGNHDAANRMTHSLRLPDNVERLDHAQASTSQSRRLAELGVALHGQSYAKSAVFENLAQSYPATQPGLFNIGLLHTSLDGAEGHEPYAPCTLDHLRQKEYDYWALGHVHTRRICSEEPPIVFPGNIQGRHIRESGAKGCFLVTVDDRGRCELEFSPLDVIRWDTCVVDVSQAQRSDDVIDLFSAELERLITTHDGLPLAVRVEVTGATEVHHALLADAVQWTNEMRGAALAHRRTQVWIEQVKWRTSPARKRQADLDHTGPLGTLLSYVEELRQQEAPWTTLAGELKSLVDKLPDGLTRGDDPLRLDDPGQWRAWLDEVEALLLSRLRDGGVA
ncbi:MAG TPA: DNA repair exonuclease [Pirellulaceae bacterium]|nr:DNA repair exonuclease [Pirellulaceae bacterium]